MDFDEQQRENHLADSRLELPPGEFEQFITGNPTVIWDTLEFCSIDQLALAVERVWKACQQNIEEGDSDFAIEIGRALTSGLRNRLASLTKGPQ